MDKSKIMEKIRKCLALSKSANEHEAAVALRQARKLMEEHGLTESHVQAAEASEVKAKAGAISKPSAWESALAGLVGKAFGCDVIFAGGWREGHWLFIGTAASPDIASYAFAVLYRQAKKARKAYADAALKRCKPATRTRRADLFCDGWVRAVRGLVGAFADRSEAADAAVAAFIELKHPELGTLTARDRNEKGPSREHEWRDLQAGHLAGKSAQLNQGVTGNAPHKQLSV